MSEVDHTSLLTQEQRTNLETAKIAWEELQRFFAQGLVVVVDTDLNLVEVAAAFVKDDSRHIKGLMDKTHVRKAVDEDAKRWNSQDAELWAVVAAPWVLVQES